MHFDSNSTLYLHCVLGPVVGGQTLLKFILPNKMIIMNLTIIRLYTYKLDSLAVFASSNQKQLLQYMSSDTVTYRWQYQGAKTDCVKVGHHFCTW